MWGKGVRELLDLWLYETHIARTVGTRRDRLRLEYTDEAVDRWGLGSLILSVSAPLDPYPVKPSLTKAILEGLLPEGEALEVLFRGFGASGIELLRDLGKDTIGALVVVPALEVPSPDQDDDPAGTAPLSEGEIATRLRALPGAPLGMSPGIPEPRLSVPGAQPKLPLRRVEGGFATPTIGHPSDVILKPEFAWPGVVRLEEWGLRVMRESQVAVPSARIAHFDGIPTLVIDRFDRRIDPVSGGVERIHQEDLCMALGARPTEKYALGRNSRTSLRNQARVIHGSVRDPGRAIRDFTTALVVNVAIGNCDAHARNVSLMHLEDGTVRLAPFYDVIPTVHFPQLDRRLAQPINANVYRPESVTRSHLLAEVTGWGLPLVASTLVDEAIDRVKSGLAAVGPLGESENVDELLGRFDRLVLRSA